MGCIVVEYTCTRTMTLYMYMYINIFGSVFLEQKTAKNDGTQYVSARKQTWVHTLYLFYADIVDPFLHQLIQVAKN